MKSGYEIQNYNCDNPKNILVSNYEGINEIYNTGLYLIDINIFIKASHNIGVWRIKYKK